MQPDQPRPRLVAAAVLTGTLTILDLAIVLPILTSIGRDLGALSEVSWLVAAYLVASTVTIPVWGRAMDLRGERTAVLSSLVVFMVGLVLAALAPTMAALIAARVVQGIGAGGTVTFGQAVLAARCDKARRARLQVWYQASYGITFAVGPLLGSALTRASWRWAFVVIMPFVVVAFLLYLGQLRKAPQAKNLPPFDVRGSFLVTVWMVALLIGVESLSSGGPVELVGFAVAVVTTPLLILHFKSAANPLIPRGIFGNRVIVLASLMMLLIGFAQFAFVTYLPALSEFYDNRVNTGIAVALMMVPYVLVGAVGAVLALKTGTRVLGLVASVGTVVAGVIVAQALNLPGLYLAAVVMGVSLAMTMIPMLLLCQHAAAHADMGAATSLPILMRNFGGALGAAVIAALAARFETQADPASGLAQSFWAVVAVGVVALVVAAFMPRRDKELKLLAEHEPQVPMHHHA